MKKEATLSIRLKTPDKNPKGKLCLRITYNGRTQWYSIPHANDYLISKADFESQRSKNYKNAMENASTAERIAKDIVSELNLNHDFSFQKFKEKYDEALNGKKKDLTSLRDIMEDYIIGLAPKTQSLYRTSVNWAERYSPGVHISDINENWIHGYMSFIRKSYKKENSKDISDNTLRLYIRNLRAVYNHALEKQITSGANPFVKIKGFSTTSSRKVNAGLTNDQMQKLITYTPDNEHEKSARNFFILSFLCSGANIGDLLRLRNKCIDTERNQLSFVRQKTRKRNGSPIVIPLCPITLDFIKECGGVINSNNPDDYIFPFLYGCRTEKAISNKIHDIIANINKGLSDISSKLGLRHITSGNARHTYASLAIENGLNFNDIKLSMGHSSIRTTEGYVSSIVLVESAQAKNRSFIKKVFSGTLKKD